MAETSMFWTTNGTGHGVGSGYSSARWQNFLNKMFISDQAASACVLNGVANELAVSGVSSPVAVATGAAIAYAFEYENDASLNIAIATPSVGLTGGHIVLEANWAAQTVTAKSVRNTDGVAAIPALVQTPNTTYQIRLATYTISTGGVVTLIDTRKRVKFSNHVYANGFDTSAVDNNTIELGSGALRVKDAGVTAAKLAAAVAGNGLSGGAGTALAVNVDASTIEINTDILRVKDLGITTAKLALDSVDDTIAGNRVPQFYRRQGASATDWSSAGTTLQTPTSVRMQAGVKVFAFGATANGSLAITFPVAFSNKPLVYVTVVSVSGGRYIVAQVTTGSILTTGFTLDLGTLDQLAYTGNVNIDWLAIGPE